jgi:hypothetical protein
MIVASLEAVEEPFEKNGDAREDTHHCDHAYNGGWWSVPDHEDEDGKVRYEYHDRCFLQPAGEGQVDEEDDEEDAEADLHHEGNDEEGDHTRVHERVQTLE